MKRAAFTAAALAAMSGVRSVAPAQDVDLKLAQIEGATDGRLGVAAFDAHGMQRVSYRPGERFPMCSTFKLLAVADILTHVDNGTLSLDRRVHYTAADLLEYAPTAKQNVARGWMTIRELCTAAITLSDNTSANLVLKQVGGPAGVTRYARSIGDHYTRLDRIEPFLNSGIPGDPRDTTTPESTGFDLYKLLLRDALSARSRAMLADWLRRSTTGLNLLRAGFPSSWRVGDKTGLGGQHTASGDSDTRNDIAIVWPPGRPPFIAAVYLTGVKISAQQRDAALAEVARVITPVFS
ncbi:MAG: class A beta-lactamase [Vulcanimicrobiaceae bacterium]